MTSRDRKDSRRARVNEGADETVPVAKLQALVEWHERRGKIRRSQAGDLSLIPRATAIGSADTHEVAAALLSRVIEGKSVDL